MFQTPVYTLLQTPETPSQEARSYLATDPALIVLYKQLRDKSLQTLRGASQISPRVEWDFVMQTARLYDRMGCDLLALDLGTPFPILPTLSFSSSHPHLCPSSYFQPLVHYRRLTLSHSRPPPNLPVPTANVSPHHSPQLGVPCHTQRHAAAPKPDPRSRQDAPAPQQPRGRRLAEPKPPG